MENLDQIQQILGKLRDTYQNNPNHVDLDGVFVMLNDWQDSNALLILEFLTDDISTEKYPLFKTIVENKKTVKVVNIVSDRLLKSQNDRFQIACFVLLNYLSEKLPDYETTFSEKFNNLINAFLGKHDANPIILNNANFIPTIESIKLVTRYEIKKYYQKSLYILLQVPLVQEDQSQLLVKQSSIIFNKNDSAYSYLLEGLLYECQFDFLSLMQNLPDEFIDISNKILYSQYGFVGSFQEYGQTETYQSDEIQNALLFTLENIYDEYNEYNPYYTEYEDCAVKFELSAKIVDKYFFTILRNYYIENDNITNRKCIFFAVRFFFLESKSFLSDVANKFRDLIGQFNDFTKQHDLDTCLDESYVQKFLDHIVYGENIE